MTTCVRRGRTYWTTCPCADCIRDRSRTRKLHSVGRRRAVSHDEAWAILAAKFDAGWTALALASACGLDDHHFSRRHHSRWARGEEVYIGPVVAQALANMGRPTAGQVGAEPSRRRLRALAAIGHGLRSIEANSGVKFSTLAAVRNSNARCGARIANAIADCYDRLHMTPGDDVQATRMAREKGWPAPLAYDDIDDLTEQPATERNYAPADRAELIRAMAERGDNVTTASRSLHLSVASLMRWCHNHDLRDEYLALASREGDWNSAGRYGRDGAA